MINKVILVGNLGQDPEVRTLENGTKVAKFSVATNENYQDKSGEWQTITEWHNVVAWRRLAETCENYLKKGGKVYVEGKLTTRKWQDQNGNDRYSTDVVARILRNLERRESTGGGGPNNFPSAKDEFPASKINTSAPPTDINNAAPKKLEVTEDDDLPF